MSSLSHFPTYSVPGVEPDAGQLQAAIDSSLFDDIYRSEWEHRQKVQSELALAHEALLEAVLYIAPLVISERLEKHPRFLDHLETRDWMALLREAKQVGLGWWATAGQEQLRTEIRRLEEEMVALDKALRINQNSEQTLQDKFDQLQVEHNLWLQARQPLPILTAHTLSLPAPPDKPPKQYAGVFSNENTWQRSCTLVNILAITGWSLTKAVTEILAEFIGVTNTSGTISRLLKRLERAGLIMRESLSIPSGVITLVELTEEGRQLALLLGIHPVETEWQRIKRRLQRAPDERLALICQFAANARRRGYAAQVAPETPYIEDGADALLVGGSGEQIYVFVEERPASKRLKAWRQVAKAQGFVALCATTPVASQALLTSARADGMTLKITDLLTLRDQKHRPLWTQQIMLQAES